MSFLRFENLSKSFDGRTLFDSISFNFGSTGLFVLLGPSGCGKTTLFHILMGLESLDKGQIFFKGKKLLTEKDYLKFRKHCSFLFQEYGIINYLTIKENLLLGGNSFKINKGSIIENYNLEMSAGLLSGGEKQRLALFKALSKNPEIIFCDEPTGALDEINSIKIMDLLKMESRKRLVILVTHNMELAKKYGDTIIRINNKSIVKERMIIKKTENNIFKNKINYLSGILIACISFFKEKWKIFFSLISLSLSLISFIFLFSFKYSSLKVIEDQIMTYVDYSQIKVSEIVNTKIEGTSFSISNTICPLYDNVHKLVKEYANVTYSYDALFVNSIIKTNNNDLESNIIICNLDEEIAVNRLLFELLDQQNLSITINKTISTIINKKIIIDNINYNIETKITKYYDEFSFLNIPCIFISNQYIEEQIKQIELKNLSKHLNDKITIFDRLTRFIDRKEELSSFALNINVYKKEDVIKVSRIINNYEYENIKYETTSRSLITYNTLSSSIELLNMLMIFFVIISFIVSIILLYLVLSSSFKFRIKEFALYKTYGISNALFFLYNFLPMSFFCLLSFSLSIFGYKYMKTIIKNSLYPFFNCDLLYYSNEIFNRTYIILIFLLFITIIFSILTCYKWKKIKVSEVIKSE